MITGRIDTMRLFSLALFNLIQEPVNPAGCGIYMLQDIRDNSQGVIAKVIIGLIVAIFALFGVESIIGGFVTSPPVAEVNGEEINEVQLQTATQGILNSIGGNPGSLDQELLEQIALNQLIEETVLRQLAEEQTMLVSSDRIDISMIANPNFQIDGIFDPDLAVRTIASQGFSVPVYRETLRQQMELSQIANAYSRSNFVASAELQRAVELTRAVRLRAGLCWATASACTTWCTIRVRLCAAVHGGN